MTEKLICTDASLDEVTRSYVLRTQNGFEKLRTAGSQLTGCLLLIATTKKVADEAPLLLVLARTALSEAESDICGLEPSQRGAHHRRHMLEALSAFDQVQTKAQTLRGAGDGPEVDELLRLLQFGWSALAGASNVLPGFELVDVSQACCAACRNVPPPTTQHFL